MSAIKTPVSLGWHENTVIGKIEYPVLDANRETICIATTAKHGEAIHDALNKQAELQTDLELRNHQYDVACKELERLRELASLAANTDLSLASNLEAVQNIILTARELLQTDEVGNG